MTQRQITKTVTNFIIASFAYTPYKGQVRMCRGTLTIDNRQDFAPFNTTAQIASEATKLEFKAIGTSSAKPCFEIK